MKQPKRHFFVCTNTRPPFAGASCGAREGHQIMMLLKDEVEKKGLSEEIKITGCGCLGPCDDGPVLVVYPEATWYAGVSTQDLGEIVERHMQQGKPVARLIFEAD